jgi:hypothetical protein
MFFRVTELAASVPANNKYRLFVFSLSFGYSFFLSVERYSTRSTASCFIEASKR